MRMIDCETVDDIMTEFAKRDPAGYVVWGAELLGAHERELAAKDSEIEKLRALVGELADAASDNMTAQCLHCDLQYACHEGEDGIVAPCSSVIKLREALHKAREEAAK